MFFIRFILCHKKFEPEGRKGPYCFEGVKEQVIEEAANFSGVLNRFLSTWWSSYERSHKYQEFSTDFPLGSRVSGNFVFLSRRREILAHKATLNSKDEVILLGRSVVGKLQKLCPFTWEDQFYVHSRREHFLNSFFKPFPP